MVELILESGETIFVNPAHVVAVRRELAPDGKNHTYVIFDQPVTTRMGAVNYVSTFMVDARNVALSLGLAP